MVSLEESGISFPSFLNFSVVLSNWKGPAFATEEDKLLLCLLRRIMAFTLAPRTTGLNGLVI